MWGLTLRSHPVSFLRAELSDKRSRRFNLPNLDYVTRVIETSQNCQASQARNNLAQDFQPFGGCIERLDRQARCIATWPRQTGNVATPNRISQQCKDDRHSQNRVLDRKRRTSRRYDDINLHPCELDRDFGTALVAPFGPAIFDRDSATLDPAEFAKPQ
jgi:hypothetical protein